MIAIITKYDLNHFQNGPTLYEIKVFIVRRNQLPLLILLD